MYTFLYPSKPQFEIISSAALKAERFPKLHYKKILRMN